jgi:uncharacterized membrane protein
MAQSKTKPNAPHWPAWLAAFAVALIMLTLPDQMTAGPAWLLFVVLALLSVPWLIARVRGHLYFQNVVGHAVRAATTAATLYSIGVLIMGLPEHRESAVGLLRTAGALWFSNILVFASWYWRLDAGGPHARAGRTRHTAEEGAFLFPQMTLDDNQWKPGFVDYLFVAFNTSTAFSPTDTAVLSRWAKVLMMLQSAISLTTVAILAARAINAL